MHAAECPHCLEHTPLQNSGAGAIVDCSRCNHSFALPARPDGPAVAWAPTESAPLQGSTAPSISPTEVPVVLCGAVGAVATLVFYVGIVGPLENTYFGQLFSARGWVPYCIALLAAWSIAMLCFKAARVRQQRACLEVDLLPSSIATRIDAENALAFSAYSQNAAQRLPPNFLSRRIESALLYLTARREAGAVAEHLARQSDADANAVDSSYTTLRVFVWAIPILGFIGTVLGIGTAVSAFSATVSAAVDIELMKQSIGYVATGLGVAFDTTLLALVTSIVLMFPMSWLQKFEEGLLARVDDYCDTKLARRIDDSPDSENDGDVASLSTSVGRSLRELDAELNRLSKSVGALSSQLSERNPR